MPPDGGIGVFGPWFFGAAGDWPPKSRRALSTTPLSARRLSTRRWRKRRRKRRDQPALLAPARNSAIDLLGRLHNMYTRERRRDGRPRPLPGNRRADEPAACDRRHVKRFRPSDRRKPGLAQELRDLRARIGSAVTKGRRIHARP